LAETAAEAGGLPHLFEISHQKKLDAFPKLAARLLESIAEGVLVLLASPNFWVNLRLSNYLDPLRGIRGLKARILYIPPFPGESLIRVASADIEEIEEYAARLLDALGDARTLRVHTPGGTEVSFECRKFYLFNYKIRDPGDYAIFHLGEVTTMPIEGTVNGIIVYDGSIYGRVPANPLKLVVEGGRVVKLMPLGDYDELIREFERDLFEKGDENATVVGEFGLGINPNCELGGSVMEDESKRGTCHFDLGDNIGLGGENKSNVHLGEVSLAPTIEADGKRVIIDGELVGWE